MVLEALERFPAGTVLPVSKKCIEHPEDHGAKRSVGLPLGQRNDFRWRLSDCRGLHVRDFGTHYEAHIDRVDPSCSLVEHLRRDAPNAYVLGACALGGLLGLLVGGGKDALVAGAAIGSVVGFVTEREKNESPYQPGRAHAGV